jgi:hypothetical protein
MYFQNDSLIKGVEGSFILYVPTCSITNLLIELIGNNISSITNLLTTNTYNI